jgi:hypothetical protein
MRLIARDTGATTPHRRRRVAGIGAAAVLAMALLVASGASATHPEASLPGSNFEIDTDANLKVDDTAPPSLDWANVTEVRATDKVNGTGDDSYAGGVKEDTACPGATTDSIPPNKSDLLSFHVYREAPTAAGPQGYLNLAWSRVSEPTGTTLMDFEFNQSGVKCASGPNTIRTAGDLLIEYAIDQGGSRADITGRTWNGSAWDSAVDLDVNSATCGGNPCAAGTINSSPIPAAESDGLITTGSKQARTFGEAQIDLRLLFQPGKCSSIGTAMLKSRSSDSFTSQLKDFVAPVAVNITNCGTVIIRKETIPDGATAVFGYTKAFPTDPASTNTFTLTDGTSKTYTNVLFGSGYTVTEDVIPADWDFVSVDCSASTGVTADTTAAPLVTFSIDSADDVLDCTYTNELQLGALAILKDSTKGGAVSQPGAVFSYNGSSVTDNGTGDEDADVGEVCVSGLSTGDYTVNETSPPPGYGDAPGSEADQVVTVVSGTNCTDSQPTGSAVATFTNPPLSDIQVNFRDGGSGETSATSITCDNTTGTGSDTPATGWDSSRTVTGVEAPTTVVCTIVIDP